MVKRAMPRPSVFARWLSPVPRRRTVTPGTGAPNRFRAVVSTTEVDPAWSLLGAAPSVRHAAVSGGGRNGPTTLARAEAVSLR